MKSLQPSLQKEIDEWLTHAWSPCAKFHEVKKSPFNDDEFMITFEVRLNVNISSKVYPLTIKNRFFTFAQYNTDANPDGDVYQLRIFLQRLDSEFQARLDSMM